MNNRNPYYVSPYSSALVKRANPATEPPPLPPGTRQVQPQSNWVADWVADRVQHGRTVRNAHKAVSNLSPDWKNLLNKHQGNIEAVLADPEARSLMMRHAPQDQQQLLALGQQLQTAQGMEAGVDRDQAYRGLYDSPYFQQLLGGEGGMMSQLPRDIKLRMLGQSTGMGWLKDAPTESSNYFQKLLWGILGGYGHNDWGGYFKNLMSAFSGELPETYQQMRVDRMPQAQVAPPAPQIPDKTPGAAPPTPPASPALPEAPKPPEPAGQQGGDVQAAKPAPPATKPVAVGDGPPEINAGDALKP